MNATHTARLLLPLAVALAFAGCRAKPAVVHGEEFPADDIPRAPQRFIDAQAASGARTDATLHETHFDGEQLNTLGRAKLGQMVRDERAIDPLTLYMNVPDHDATAEGRRRSVVMFLREQGLSESRIRFVAGVNPHTVTSAALPLERSRKAETPSAPAPAAPPPGPQR